MSSLNKHKLVFNPNMPNTCSDNIGVYLRDGYGSQLTSTDVDGYTHALDVFMQGFGPTISNEDGYLYVDFSPDLLSPDGYLNVNLAAPVVVNVDNNFEHAEDFGHVSGDIGSFALGVRNDTNAVLTSDDLDYSPLATDAYGRLKTLTALDSTLLNEDGYLYIDFSPDLLSQDGYLQVVVTNPSASEYAEDSGHISGDLGTFALGVRNDTNAVLTSNDLDYSALAVDAYGRMKVVADFDSSMLNEDGYLNVNLAGPIVVNVDNNFEYAEDSGHVSGDIGSFALGVRNDSNAVLTSNDLDYSPLAVDAYGRLKTQTDFAPSMLNEDGYLNVNIAGDSIVVNVDNNFEHAEDFGHVSGDIGSFSLAVRRDALVAGAFTSNDADYAGFNVDAYGALWSDSVGSKFDGQVDDGTDPSDRAVKIGARVFDLPLTTVGATDVRVDLAADSYRRLFINDSPNIGLLVSQNSVGLSSELLVAAALGGRRRMLIQNNADCAIYAGHDSSVSASNGFTIPGGDTLSLEIGDGLSLWVIADEAASDVRVMELA